MSKSVTSDELPYDMYVILSCFRDLLAEALMKMQDLLDCLRHEGWSFWLHSLIVKIWVFMQKELEQLMLCAHQQMQ